MHVPTGNNIAVNLCSGMNVAVQLIYCATGTDANITTRVKPTTFIRVPRLHRGNEGEQVTHVLQCDVVSRVNGASDGIRKIVGNIINDRHIVSRDNGFRWRIFPPVINHNNIRSRKN